MEVKVHVVILAWLVTPRIQVWTLQHQPLVPMAQTTPLLMELVELAGTAEEQLRRMAQVEEADFSQMVELVLLPANSVAV